jgi:hypothetical protein
MGMDRGDVVTETIISAAILYKGLIISKPGASAEDIRNAFCDVLGYRIEPDERGYLAPDGQFVEREPAPEGGCDA